MKLLFLEVDSEREWAVASIGPAFIAGHLRAHGHQVEVLRIPVDQPVADVARSVAARSPALIGVSLTSRQWLRARELVAALEPVVSAPVVAGGLHATFAPETVLASPGFDLVCLGEGEQATLDLVEALDRGDAVETLTIPNIWVRGGPRPPLRPPFEPLDDLPFMARDALDERHGVVHMVTQRGCPFPCTYCAARQYSDLYDGAYSSYGRRRSAENVIAELEAIREAGSLNYVIFLDDTFTIQHRWVESFCDDYGARLGVPFSLHARVETVSPRLLQVLADAGCRHITYGVESGSERVRRDVMRRDVSNERLREAFQWTRDAGILVTANYMLGIPGETPADVEQTLALHEELRPDDFGYFVFYPYPGTALFHLCRDKGYLPDDYETLPANHRRSVLRLPDLSPADIEHYYEAFTRVRERDQLARLGACSPEQREAMLAQTRDSAALG